MTGVGFPTLILFFKRGDIIYQIRNSGWLEVITGPMFSGKSTELIQRIEKCDIAQEDYKTFKPIIDDRYVKDKIVTHSGIEISAIPLEDSEDILEEVYEELDVVAIDEMQFWGKGLIDVINRLLQKHIRVIVSGLDKSFRGEPFEISAEILAMAEYVEKLSGVCAVCGQLGTRTQRLVDGEPAHYDEPLIKVGDSDIYECRCLKHFEIKKDSE